MTSLTWTPLGFAMSVMTFKDWLLNTATKLPTPEKAYSWLTHSELQRLHKATEFKLIAEESRHHHFPLTLSPMECLECCFATLKKQKRLCPLSSIVLLEIDLVKAKQFNLVEWRQGDAYWLVKVGNSWRDEAERIALPDCCYVVREATEFASEVTGPESSLDSRGVVSNGHPST